MNEFGVAANRSGVTAAIAEARLGRRIQCR